MSKSFYGKMSYKKIYSNQHRKKQTNHNSYYYNISSTTEDKTNRYKHNKNNNANLLNSTTYDFCRVIPKGPKYKLWFYMNNYEPIVYISKLAETNWKPYKGNYSFNLDVCIGNGTICVGTLIKYNGMRLFFMENILSSSLFPTIVFTSLSWLDIQTYIYAILDKYFKTNCSMQNMLFFGMPVYARHENELKSLIYKQISYPIYCIQYLHNDRMWYTRYEESSQPYIETFEVTADSYHDTYYIKINKEVSEYTRLLIPNYKTSVMMNKIYRYVRENTNLDYIEESEDEDEFQNINENKYVNLDKICVFRCQLNTRFNKWVPLEYIKEK